MSYYDEGEYMNSNTDYHQNHNQNAGRVRARIQSEPDIGTYFYCSDENSLDNDIDIDIDIDNASIDRETDDKNKKWLDVGARIGLKLLKSEHVQDLIAQNQLGSKTISMDRGQFADEDLFFDGGVDVQRSDSPRNQIPKPFHTMWQMGDVGDHTSDAYLFSDSDTCSESTKAELNRHRHRRLMSFSTPRSPIPVLHRMTITRSVSPPKRMRSMPLSKTLSVPSTPQRISSTSDIKKLFALSEIDANVSVTSSEAIHLVPKEFDANSHLPAAMAINRGVISDKSRMSSQVFHRKDLKMKMSDPSRSKGHRQREPLVQGVKLIVPLFPLYAGKATRNYVESSVLQLATVHSSERIALDPSISDPKFTDALSITVLLDKSFLRNGKFAKMSLRIQDKQRYFPRCVFWMGGNFYLFYMQCSKC